MDTNVLKTFIAVCEYSGFSAAAEKLGYTQSTVSSQIRQLEKELNTTLFDRFYHRIELTSDGVTALKYARDILESHEKIIAERFIWLCQALSAAGISEMIFCAFGRSFRGFI